MNPNIVLSLLQKKKKKYHNYIQTKKNIQSDLRSVTLFFPSLLFTNHEELLQLHRIFI